MSYLYRYLSLDNETKLERLFKLLNENKLYFSSPRFFNDPYDAKVHFADGSTEEIEDYLLFTHKRKYPSASDEKLLHEIRNRPPEYDYNWIRSVAIEQLEPELDKIGVVCLSEKNDDILMWSHYADAHKGICLEFDKETIDNGNWFSGKVIYPEDNRYIEFKWFRESLENNMTAIRLFLLRKSLHWRYEAEWRIIAAFKAEANHERNDERDSRLLSCPKKMLTGIIIGMKTPDSLKQIIVSSIKNTSINLYEAKRDENSYAINIIPLQVESDLGRHDARE